MLFSDSIAREDTWVVGVREGYVGGRKVMQLKEKVCVRVGASVLSKMKVWLLFGVFTYTKTIMKIMKMYAQVIDDSSSIPLCVL